MRTVSLIVCEDITERKELEDHKSALISELDHRVKNVLALVSAVATRTQETSSSMADFVALDGRIKSMATAHELLSFSRWRGIPLSDLVRNELAPYARPNKCGKVRRDFRQDRSSICSVEIHSKRTC